MDEIEALEAALKPRERAFCREYVADFCATEAVLRAGYKQTRASAAVTGSRLLRRPKVRECVDALLRERAVSAGVTRDGVVARLNDIANRCMSREPVMEWSDEEKKWVESGEWRFDSKGATRALEAMSKIMGYDQPESVEESAVAIGFDVETDDDAG